jgi:hypothetical protein
VLGDRGDPRGQATDEADQDDLHRGSPVVLGPEALRVVDVEVVGAAVLLLSTETGEAANG